MALTPDEFADWLHGSVHGPRPVRVILAEIEAAISDYIRVFPVPYSLAPNLQLASEASAAVTALWDERRLTMEASNFPEDAFLDELILHQRFIGTLNAFAEEDHRAIAAQKELAAELQAQGLPEGSSLADLIRHHRGQAALAAAMDALSVGGDEEMGLKNRLQLTAEEWRYFQNIPEQGYSHRGWVDARIRERVALALGDRAAK